MHYSSLSHIKTFANAPTFIIDVLMNRYFVTAPRSFSLIIASQSLPNNIHFSKQMGVVLLILVFNQYPLWCNGLLARSLVESQ